MVDMENIDKAATYAVTFEDEYTSGRKEKRRSTIPVTGDGLAMTLRKISFFGLNLLDVVKKGDKE